MAWHRTGDKPLHESKLSKIVSLGHSNLLARSSPPPPPPPKKKKKKKKKNTTPPLACEGMGCLLELRMPVLLLRCLCYILQYWNIINDQFNLYHFLRMLTRTRIHVSKFSDSFSSPQRRFFHAAPLFRSDMLHSVWLFRIKWMTPGFLPVCVSVSQSNLFMVSANGRWPSTSNVIWENSDITKDELGHW